MKDDDFLKESDSRHLLHPVYSLGNPQKIIADGNGVRIVESNESIFSIGEPWILHSGEFCVSAIGAIAPQLNGLTNFSTLRGMSHESVIELRHSLRELIEPARLRRSIVTSGGSGGIEIALRFARQSNEVRGEAGRPKCLSVKTVSHGPRADGAPVTGNPKSCVRHEPLMAGCFHVSPPCSYRNPFSESDPERLAGQQLAALEDEIDFQGAGTVVALVAEPGPGAGGVISDRSRMPGARKIRGRNGLLLLIVREAVTAHGRTGSWSRSCRWGAMPDVAIAAERVTNENSLSAPT